MLSNAKQALRLQQLLLKTLRPSQLSQSDCLISELATDSDEVILATEISPEYTLVYSGFFLDGIVTICITPEKKYTFIWALETLSYALSGECIVPENIILTNSSESVVQRILEEIENVNKLTIADEAKSATIN